MAITKNKTTANGSKEIATPEVRTEIDPRSKILTNQENPYNRIAVGDEVDVRGTKRMLKSKSKKATWY
jgi:hypothetical protein